MFIKTAANISYCLLQQVPCYKSTILVERSVSYPVCRTEVDSLSKVITLVEASMVCSRKCNNELPSMLVSATDLKHKQIVFKVLSM